MAKSNDIYGSDTDSFGGDCATAWSGVQSNLKTNHPDTPAFTRDFDGEGKDRNDAGSKRSPAKNND